MIDLEALRIVVGMLAGIGAMFFLTLLPVYIHKMLEQKKNMGDQAHACRQAFHNAPTMLYVLPARVPTAPSREEIAWNMQRAL